VSDQTRVGELLGKIMRKLFFSLILGLNFLMGQAYSDSAYDGDYIVRALRDIGSMDDVGSREFVDGTRSLMNKINDEIEHRKFELKRDRFTWTGGFSHPIIFNDGAREFGASSLCGRDILEKDLEDFHFVENGNKKDHIIIYICGVADRLHSSERWPLREIYANAMFEDVASNLSSDRVGFSRAAVEEKLENSESGRCDTDDCKNKCFKFLAAGFIEESIKVAYAYQYYKKIHPENAIMLKSKWRGGISSGVEDQGTYFLSKVMESKPCYLSPKN